MRSNTMTPFHTRGQNPSRAIAGWGAGCGTGGGTSWVEPDAALAANAGVVDPSGLAPAPERVPSAGTSIVATTPRGSLASSLRLAPAP